MKPASLRSLLRWGHIVAAAVIGTYLYSPWSDNAVLSFLTLWVVFPMMALSGLGMWQFGRLTRMMRGG